MSEMIAMLQLWCFNVGMSRKQRYFLACAYIGFRKIARECTLVSVELQVFGVNLRVSRPISIDPL